MAKKRSRSTDAWIQGEEGRFDPVVETPDSKFVPLENIPSGGLSPEEICILHEEDPKLLAARNPEVREAAEELLNAYGFFQPKDTEENPYDYLDGEEDRIFVATMPLLPARGLEICRVTCVSLVFYDDYDFEREFLNHYF